MIANTPTVRKVLLELDLPKSSLYETARPHGDIGTLFTETDKTKYKASVRNALLPSTI